MSNPTINRWGLNLFWYKHWLVDKNYHISLNDDTVIEKLIYIYLNYGLLYPQNVFFNKYWIKKCNFNNQKKQNLKYYRTASFKNLITKEISQHKERIKLENTHQSKVWILKFQNWIVINFYCFIPIKKRILKTKNKIKIREIDIFTSLKTNKFSKYKRLKFFFLFVLKLKLQQNEYYKF